MDLRTEYVDLSVADGTSMRAYVAHPAGNPRAGLLVFQEAFGVNAHIRDVTQRFAGQGYLAISPELFHRMAPGFESGYVDMDAAFAQLRTLTVPGLEADIRAAHAWLENAGVSQIAATGYCVGGRVACLAALTVPLACSVSYYGGGIAPSQTSSGLLDRLKDLKAPMLFFWGGLDHHIPQESVQAVTNTLRAAGKTYTNVEFSFADHGFFCDARASYNAEAAAQAWTLTLAFFETHLAGETQKGGAGA
ncbi:MAG: dienelactone hydrolase family protein [Terriglobia bacterium]|nr:MAG: dienelactone hydrolase family protein [Terriglobia bacterium]